MHAASHPFLPASSLRAELSPRPDQTRPLSIFIPAVLFNSPCTCPLDGSASATPFPVCRLVLRAPYRVRTSRLEPWLSLPSLLYHTDVQSALSSAANLPVDFSLLSRLFYSEPFTNLSNPPTNLPTTSHPHSLTPSPSHTHPHTHTHTHTKHIHHTYTHSDFSSSTTTEDLIRSWLALLDVDPPRLSTLDLPLPWSHRCVDRVCVLLLRFLQSPVATRSLQLTRLPPTEKPSALFRPEPLRTWSRW